MKKFIKYIFLSVAVVVLFGLNFGNFAVAKAQANNDSQTKAIINKYLTGFVQYGYANKITVDRRAGTYGERLSAGVIQNYLEALKTSEDEQKLVPQENSNTNSGIQSFEFFNDRTNKKETSQNVIYTLSGKTKNKKVVISCNYDNFFGPYTLQDDQIITPGEDFSEGINASAGSVAVLLTLAEMLPQNYFDFNIDFVFFGASYSGDSGAKYYGQTLSVEDRANTLLHIDISRIALGEDVYYYTGNFGSKQENYYKNTLNALKKYKSSISGSSTPSDSSLGYYNAGYSGATAVLEDGGYNLVHLFAGAYSSGVVSGFREYTGKDNITNSANDSLDYINAHYATSSLDNMLKAVVGVNSIITGNNFVESFSQTKNNKTLYKMFSSNSYVGIAMVVTILLLLIVCIIVHYNLSKKAYNFIYDNKITSIALKIEDEEEVSKKETSKND